MVDVLHTIDQGLSSHVVANVLWFIFVLRAALGGNTYADRIKLAADNLKAWYKKNKCSSKLQGKLTQERLRKDGDWPKLSAKAAATRHLASYALYVMQTFGQFASLDVFRREHDTLALGVCQLLVRFYEILELNSMFLTDADKVELPNLANQLMGMYSKLAVMCADRQLRLWKVSPKMHLFLHLCIEQAVACGNPRFYWTYGDEDLVGILIGVAEGVHPSTLAISVLTKWLHCVFDELLIDPYVDPRDF
jgi:hypothetical protein